MKKNSQTQLYQQPSRMFRIVWLSCSILSALGALVYLLLLLVAGNPSGVDTDILFIFGFAGLLIFASKSMAQYGRNLWAWMLLILLCIPILLLIVFLVMLLLTPFRWQ